MQATGKKWCRITVENNGIAVKWGCDNWHAVLDDFKGRYTSALFNSQDKIWRVATVHKGAVIAWARETFGEPAVTVVGSVSGESKGGENRAGSEWKWDDFSRWGAANGGNSWQNSYNRQADDADRFFRDNPGSSWSDYDKFKSGEGTWRKAYSTAGGYSSADQKRQQQQSSSGTASFSGRDIMHYEVLCVTPAAPWAVIKAAYKAMSLLNHPDQGGNEEAMKKINASFDALKAIHGKAG